MLKKHAVRFIHAGSSRTYIVNDLGVCDAICTALDLLEADIPEMASAIGLAVIGKAYPDGGHLADEGEGPVIDTTRLHVAARDYLVAA
jgi:hypothetical protein